VTAKHNGAKNQPVAPENPSSTVPDRVCVRIDGISYLIPVAQVEAFRAKYAGRPHHDEGFEV
jgi:hypothetical protein